MTYRNRKLLNLSHDTPCMAEFEHDCVGYRGSEPAHADWSEFGRGIGHKSDDCFVAAMCHNAHRMISAQINPPFDRETRKAHWLKAHFKTMKYWFENDKLRVNGR